MTFRTPDFLWLLLLVPPWIVLYRWILRRPSRETIKHAHVALIRMAAGRGQALRRHAAAVLFLLALAAVILALGRPVAPLPVPSNQTAVMLSIDVSRSMLAQDMHPNRLEAAKTAAREFVKVLPRGTRVGLVTFSSYASLIVPPTADHGRVVEAIDDLSAEFATAIGDGLLEAVWALPGRTRPEDPLTPPREPRGALPPAVVVLLSDGQSNRGALPSEAARIAKQQQIKVYTVGIGTPEGTFLTLGGRSIWVRLDEETLKEVAEIGGGRYFHASSTMELRQVYRQLGRTIGWERKPTEVSALAAVGALLLTAASLVLSRGWLHPLG